MHVCLLGELATWFPMKINRLSNNLCLPRMIIKPEERVREMERERERECPLCRWNVSETVIVIYLCEMKVNSDVQPAWQSLSANHENKLSHWNRYVLLAHTAGILWAMDGWTLQIIIGKYCRIQLMHLKDTFIEGSHNLNDSGCNFACYKSNLQSFMFHIFHFSHVSLPFLFFVPRKVWSIFPCFRNSVLTETSTAFTK